MDTFPVKKRSIGIGFSPETKKSRYGLLVNTITSAFFYGGDYYPGLLGFPPALYDDNSDHYPEYSHDADDKRYE